MKRNDHELDYYEDEGEFLEDELPERFSQKVVAVFGTSYGISILAHGALLLVLMSIMIAVPVEDEVFRIEAKTAPKPFEPPLDAKNDDRDHLEVPLPEEVEIPVVDLVEEPVVAEVPKGAEDAVANKTVEVDAKSFVDAIGVGAGMPAGAFGRADGIGRASETGGGPATINSVKNALRWLAAHQSPDGRWDSDGWDRNCSSSRGPSCKGPGTAHGGAAFDVGQTSLALLAYMGHGNSHRFGEYKRIVSKGLRWLRRQQRSDGSLGYHDAGHGGAYNHALAAMALCESYAVSRDPRLRKPAQRSIAFILDAQNPKLGWRYEVKSGRNDTSVTGWMVLALKAARAGGLEVPQAAFEGAQAWFKRATVTSGEVGYDAPGTGPAVLPANVDTFDPQPTPTAVAVVCRIFTGERKSEEGIRRGARLLADFPPEWTPRRLNFYYWYYATYALYHFDDAKWGPWNEKMKKALLPNQRVGGCEAGSWDPVGEWCLRGGRVYATAINALTMEIYYRYQRAKTK